MKHQLYLQAFDVEYESVAKNPKLLQLVQCPDWIVVKRPCHCGRPNKAKGGQMLCEELKHQTFQIDR